MPTTAKRFGKPNDCQYLCCPKRRGFSGILITNRVLILVILVSHSVFFRSSMFLEVATFLSLSIRQASKALHK